LGSSPRPPGSGWIKWEGGKVEWKEGKKQKEGREGKKRKREGSGKAKPLNINPGCGTGLAQAF